MARSLRVSDRLRFSQGHHHLRASGPASITDQGRIQRAVVVVSRRSRGCVSAYRGIRIERKHAAHGAIGGTLLAKADPVAAIRLAVPALLGRCNDPNWLLDEALEDVWEEWHEHVDPLISGALRLTLGKSLDKRDRTQIQRLVDDTALDRETARRLDDMAASASGRTAGCVQLLKQRRTPGERRRRVVRSEQRRRIGRFAHRVVRAGRVRHHPSRQKQLQAFRQLRNRRPRW